MAPCRMSLILIVLSTVHAASGLKCYVCTGVTTGSTNSAVTTALSAVGFTKNDDCVNAVTSKLTSSTCETTVTGKKAMCAYRKGKVDGTVSGVTYTAEGSYRFCDIVDTADATEGCKDKTDVSIFPSTIGITKYVGVKCLCSNEDNCNGQTANAPALITCLASLVVGIFAVL